MTQRPSRRSAVAVLGAGLIAVVAAACSGAGNVGAGVNTQQHGSGNLAFGQTTTTSTMLVLTIPPPPTTAKAAVVTAPPTTQHRVTATTQAVQSYQIITINGDNSAQTQFSPASLAVYVNTPVHFQNKDTKPRSVVSNDGTSFRSPTIPPGGEWIYLASTVGQFPYQDGTRPYAVGTLTVESR